MVIRHNYMWFYVLYQRAFNSLENIQSAMTFSVEKDPHMPDGVAYFYSDFYEFRNRFTEFLSLMQVDWNTAKICMERKRDIEEILSDNFSAKSVMASMVKLNKLWNSSGIAKTTIYSMKSSFAPFPINGVNRADSECIRNLSNLRTKIEEIYEATDAYINVVNDLVATPSFSGDFARNVKSYFEQMHLTIIRAATQFLNRLSLYTSQYQLQYQLTIRERDYTYNTSDLQGFINAMRYIRSEWGSLQSDFNSKVDSFNRSNHEICLVALSGTQLDTFFTKIDNSIRICENIIAQVNKVEDFGDKAHSELRSDINCFKNAYDAISARTGYRVLNYENDGYLNMICRSDAKDLDDLGGKPRKKKESVLDIKDDNLRNLELINKGDSDQIAKAQEYLRNHMVSDLIESFQNKEAERYFYSAYQRYDDNVIRGKISGIDLDDKALVASASKLYTSLLGNGFTNEDAMKYTEISMLYNSDALKGSSSVNEDYKNLTLNGIRACAGDFASYVADDKNSGYCQINRWTGDFDCSSLVVAAYVKAGVPLQDMDLLEGHNPRNPITSDMTPAAMGEYGFVDHKPSGVAGTMDDLCNSDMLVDESNHAELYVGNGETVSAHGSEDAFRGRASDPRFRMGNGAGDQFQGCSVERFENPPEPGEYNGVPVNTKWYYETSVVPELDNISDQEHGTDARGHDRVGEIRFERVVDENNTVMGDWDHYYRLEDLDKLRDKIAELRAQGKY